MCAGTLRQEIGRIAVGGGTVGTAVVLLETGERVELHGARPFPMQSVYKLPIAMAVLKEIDSGRLRLDQKVRIEKADLTPPVVSPLREEFPEGGVEIPVRELLRAMIVQSDGLACDLLLKLMPPANVTRYLRGLGITDMTVATSEKAMALDKKAQYRNHATPEAAVALLSLLHQGRGLSAASREMLLADLTVVETGPRRLKGGFPRDGRRAQDRDLGDTQRTDAGHQRHRDHHAPGRAAPGRRGFRNGFASAGERARRRDRRDRARGVGLLDDGDVESVDPAVVAPSPRPSPGGRGGGPTSWVSRTTPCTGRSPRLRASRRG